MGIITGAKYGDYFMNILIVNDDGIYSDNIFRLKAVLKNYGNVFICVPDGERSGSSHSTKKYNVVEENFKKYKKDENTYYHTGTASDSIKFFFKFVSKDVNLVVSGVNEGFNLGVDTVYSGTVGAALEANVFGVRSIALSARKKSELYWDKLPLVLDLLLNKLDWADVKCFNVNFPDFYADENDLIRFAQVSKNNKKFQENSDYDLCRNKGYITLSPLKYDLTDEESLVKLLKKL